MKVHSAPPPFDLLGQTAVIGGHNRKDQILYNVSSHWATDKNCFYIIPRFSAFFNTLRVVADKKFANANIIFPQ
jgi:hypothetical protein